MAKGLCEFDDIIKEAHSLLAVTLGSTPLPNVIIEFEKCMADVREASKSQKNEVVVSKEGKIGTQKGGNTFKIRY